MHIERNEKLHSSYEKLQLVVDKLFEELPPEKKIHFDDLEPDELVQVKRLVAVFGVGSGNAERATETLRVAMAAGDFTPNYSDLYAHTVLEKFSPYVEILAREAHSRLSTKKDKLQQYDRVASIDFYITLITVWQRASKKELLSHF